MDTKVESYFVFMSYDPEYGRLQADRTKRGVHELDLYLDRKHDELLASTLEPGSYKKTSSLVIVDAFAVEITEDQANVLRSAKGVRVVEKNENFYFCLCLYVFRSATLHAREQCGGYARP
ncbi:Subtilisin-like protease SBT2.5 [Glycine soja]